MLEILFFFFFFCSFLLFIFIKVEPLREKILPKKYWQKEESWGKQLENNLRKQKLTTVLLTLFLALVFVLLILLKSNLKPRYSIWVIVFGIFYSLLKDYKNRKIEKIYK